jgi:hypothetical protein
MSDRFSVGASPPLGRTPQATPTKGKKKSQNVSATFQRTSPKNETSIPAARATEPTSKKYARKLDSGGPLQPATSTVRDLISEHEVLADEYEQVLQERNRLREECQSLRDEIAAGSA